ncbi:MAG: SUMF1/EgtB/PvdO family nonheme iron enzyme [Candidatus Eremiobacteraeota bacterium]|nr:SUMF1/EgtB/PvdO family nonheme iron enzyme [Candidatus Eremiobacteraeota bacterium]
MAGGNDSCFYGDDECPRHKVYLDEYYLYKYQVTFEQFRKFVNATGFNADGDWEKHESKGKERHPVQYVTWGDAAAYCRWAGGDLPTEAQHRFGLLGGLRFLRLLRHL